MFTGSFSVSASTLFRSLGQRLVLAGSLVVPLASSSAQTPLAPPAAGEPASAESVAAREALRNYVARPDASYHWTVRRRGVLLGVEFAELILTSQEWRGTTWRHQLFVMNPPTRRDDSRQGFFFIGGGRWNEELLRPLPAAAAGGGGAEGGDRGENLPDEARVFAAFAVQLKSPVAVLMQVPFQPMFDGMVEDEIIAYTFQNYLETGDHEWPLLLPMVKAAARGMDATIEFADQQLNIPLETFTVSGASKRGWTTWLTGAVDDRATAIAPMVIDVLDMARQMRHQRAVWGGVSEQIGDYTERGLTDELDTARGEQLRTIVDPYQYRDRLRKPKLLIMGTNDRYWPIDALNLYWDDLDGEKRVMYVPNNGHGIRDLARLTGSLNALHQQAARGFQLAQPTWKYEAGGGGTELVLTVSSDQRPKEAVVWWAESDDQDFRDERWVQRPLDRRGPLEFQTRQSNGGKRFVAMFGELTFECDEVPYFLSTNVRVMDWKRQVE